MPTNRRTAETDGIDFYPTPEWATDALLENEIFYGNIWEPACGDGAMSERLQKYYPDREIYSTDLYEHGYGATGADFLQTADDFRMDNIITNPPYEIANDFVITSLKHARNKVAMLMRLAFLEGQERYHTIFKTNPPARVWVFCERITMYKKYAEEKKGSGTTAYAWFVWQKGYSGPTKIMWLPPGYKK
jgi:hypothetical protein